MRIALVHIARGMDGTPVSPVVEHLGLSMLAGSLENAGHEVVIYDTLLQTIDDTEVPVLLERWHPELIGFTLNYSNTEATFPVAAECGHRLPGVPLLAGGYYATFHYETLLAEGSPFRAVILGEGEISFVRMAARRSYDWSDIPGVALRINGRVRVTRPERPPSFSKLPGRSLMQVGHLTRFPRGCFRVAIEASRGCSHACNFCSISACQGMAGDLGTRRLRDPRSIAGEIKIIAEDYDLRDFWFMDADFFGPASDQEHVLSTAEAIADLQLDLTLEADARADGITSLLVEKLRDAGLERCFLGIESFDDATLRKLGKGSSEAINLKALQILETYDVRPIIGMIMFHPWSTREQLRHDHARLRVFGYEKTQMLFRLKKYRGSKDAKRTDSDGKGVLPWADYGWEFADQEVAEIWDAFDALRLEALDKVFLHLTAELHMGRISPTEFMKRSDSVFNKFGRDIDSILG